MKNSSRFFTLSNIISVFRLLLAVPVCYGILDHWSDSLLLILALLAYTSDILDGYLARMYNDISEWGKILDPLADKILVGSASISLMIVGKLSIWYIALVLGRDIAILIAGLLSSRKLGYVLPSTYLGKGAVITVAITLICSFVDSLHMYIQASYILSSIMLIISFFHYGIRLKSFLSPTNNA
jgi:CDP-diacylglycerol--glycerol-3-phosphate 3-phosphatidyltransferase